MQTFNQFFIRELKPGVRPIAYENNDAVAVSAADCRLMAFNSVDDATRFWIKVHFIYSGVTFWHSIRLFLSSSVLNLKCVFAGPEVFTGRSTD